MEGMEHKVVEEGGSEIPELPSILELLGVDMHSHLFGLPMIDWVPVFMSFAVILFLTGLAFLSTRNLKKQPGALQATVEMIVLGLEDFLKGIMGPFASKHLPLLGTLFIYILTMNLWGHIPTMHSPTNKLGTTLALALVIFFVTHYEGAKKYGAWGYVRHHMIGPVPWMLGPLMLVIHIVSELARPISLSIRLFCNILGEDVIIGMIVLLVAPFFVPVHIIVSLLALLFSLIQALVFTLLSAVYIGGAVGALEGEGH
ncbi:MAG: F0F1 ATP synthase subunit A [Candidatus Hydrogenedentota bacterium]|nr:MAG: F0F1 ATP synthase subunit A [Candidatus Hydrogenedentota bacterium]